MVGEMRNSRVVQSQSCPRPFYRAFGTLISCYNTRLEPIPGNLAELDYRGYNISEDLISSYSTLFLPGCTPHLPGMEYPLINVLVLIAHRLIMMTFLCYRNSNLSLHTTDRHFLSYHVDSDFSPSTVLSTDLRLMFAD